MYYKVKLKDYIRVPPEEFDKPTEAAIVKEIGRKYDGFISPDLGVVIGVLNVGEIGEGVIITGDGASYFDPMFNL